MITEDAILNFIPTRVSGTGFSGLNLSSGSRFRIPAFPYAQQDLVKVNFDEFPPSFREN